MGIIDIGTDAFTVMNLINKEESGGIKDSDILICVKNCGNSVTIYWRKSATDLTVHGTKLKVEGNELKKGCEEAIFGHNLLHESLELARCFFLIRKVCGAGGLNVLTCIHNKQRTKRFYMPDRRTIFSGSLTKLWASPPLGRCYTH